ncbi:hypothetical protein FOYG_14177 [Fusarium oxysporum NRRL 32931]|uniref:Uncharacterized protein n=1 Tax=Fusarium oxysporum NRRL 32931 TaxID=660029 RepID=W9HII3_FUSOX|nr:hypothetical protein FOYG_14177 [Fusarium oxysporum NRRL 32931]
MPKVTSSCELMDNAFPAAKVKLKGDFFVAQDEAGENMIFSVDDDGALQLILRNEMGDNAIVHLSSKFGVAAAEVVTALAVNQDADGTIHLVFAARQKDGSSKLFVVEPMAPKRQDWNTTESLMSRLYSGEQWAINIREFLIGSSNDKKNTYPCFYMTFNHIDKTTEDVWAVCVDPVTRQWSRQKTFELPTNAITVLGKCPGNIPLHRGLFVLYEESDSLQLKFIGFNPTKENPTLRSFAQPVPKGATTLASFESDSGFTDLLVSGADGLSYRTAQQVFQVDKSPFTVLSSDPAFEHTTQMQVAQTKEHLSIWSLSPEKALCYQEFSIPAKGSLPAEITPVIPLLDKVSKDGRFACLRNPKLGQRLFFVDDTDTIRMFEQSVESGMWQQPVEISIPHSDKMIEFSSHTILVTVEEIDGTPMALEPLLLCSSISVECLVNGVWIRTSPTDKKEVSTDASGQLTVIIRSEGLSTPVITLTSGTSGKKIFSGGRLEIDPMQKLWSTIGKISSAQDLKNMKLPDGSSFVREGLSDKELEEAAKTLSHLHKVKSEMADDEANGIFDSIKQGFQTIANRAWGAIMSISNKIKEVVESGVNKVKEVVEIAVKKVKEAWNFVVEVKDKVWNFVLETASQVAAAMQTVLDTVVKGWEYLKEKLGFIFNWGDIVKTKNIIANMTTQGILLLADGTPYVEIKTHAFFEKMRGKIKELKDKKLPPGFEDMKTGKNEEMRKKAKEKDGAKEEINKTDKDTKTPQAQYGSYHLKHSRGAEAKQNTPFDRILERLKDVMEEAGQLASRLWDNIKDLIDLHGEVSIGTLLTKLGFELLEDILDVVESMLIAFLGSISDLLLLIAHKINETIKIPVLSALYRKVSGGADLTLLDAISLVIAIPATIVFKLVKGKSPSKMEGAEWLTKPNALRGKLSARMAGLSSDSMETSYAPVITKRSMAICINEDDTEPSVAVEKHANSNSNMGPVVEALQTQTFSIESSNNENTEEDTVQTSLKKAWKEYRDTAHPVEDLLLIGSPATSILEYTFIIWPTIYSPDSISNYKAPMASLISWICSIHRFVSFRDTSPLSAETDTPGFLPKFALWIASGIPILGSFIARRIGHVLGVISGCFQVFLLAWEQIEVHAVYNEYSVYLALEEWLITVAKLVHYSAGVSRNPPTAKVALVLCNAGMAMATARSIAEGMGKTKRLDSGVSPCP